MSYQENILNSDVTNEQASPLLTKKTAKKSPRISDTILDRLNTMILAGTFKTGDKLPSERELAEKLNTSRPSVRAALAKLETQGLIVRVQGGGTYVSDKIEASFTDSMVELFHENHDFKYDLLEYRQALEEASCFYAAVRATPEEKQVIQKKYDEWLALHNTPNCEPELQAEADLAFHLSIADATHNILLPHTMRSSLKLIEHSVTLSLKAMYPSEERKKKLYDQHTAILNCVLASDGNASRNAVRDHLNFVCTEVEKADIQQIRESQKRFRH